MATADQENDKLNPAKNVGQDDFDKKIDQNYGPRDQASTPGSPRTQDDVSDNLSSRENDAASVGSSDDSSESSDLQNKEASGDAGWKDSTSSKSRGSSIKNSRDLYKKGSLVFASVGLIFSFVGILFSITMMALGLINFKEVPFGNLGERMRDVMERRAIRVQAKKFNRDLTTGCGVVKVKCRYKGFSDREIKKFNRRNGVNGYRLEVDTSRRSLNPLKKPVRLVKIDAGKFDPTDPYKEIPGKVVASSKIRQVLRTDPALRKSMNTFWKSEAEVYAGRAAKGVFIRTKTFLGKRVLKEGVGNTDEEKSKSNARQLTRESTSGDLFDANVSSGLDGSTGDPELDRQENEKVKGMTDDVQEATEKRSEELKADRDNYEKSLKEPELGTPEHEAMHAESSEKIRNKGGGISGFFNPNPLASVQGFCTVKMLVGAVNSARYIAQATQLINYSIMFASVADRIKAGEADGNTSAQISTLMNMLNSTDSSGKTAFDSFGYNYAATGAIRPGKDEDIGRYQNGGEPPGLFGEVVQASVDEIPDKICKVALSTEATVIGIGLYLIPGAGTLAAAAAKGVIKAASQGITKTLTKKIESKIIKNFIKKQIEKGTATRAGVEAAKFGAMYAFYDLGVPPLVSGISRALTRTIVTGDETGRDVGNAAISGVGATISQISKAQGMQPINETQATKWSEIARANQLKIAKEEGVNQFDFSNRFSFAHNFAIAIYPSLTGFSNITSIGNKVASINSQAFSSIINVAGASNEGAAYKFCVDNKLKEKDVAGDPFCNAQYGMDPTILSGENYDPEAVIDYLVDKSLIDEEGNPAGEFTEFIEKCINTTTPLGDDEDMCTKKDSQNYTMMRLYCMDSSVDVDMNDGEGISCAPESPTSAPSAGRVSSTSLPSGSAKELAEQIISSNKVSGDEKYISQIRNIANGNGSCPVSEKILGLILSLSEKYKLTISSLNRKCTGILTASGEGSLHYAGGGGRAVDFSGVDDVTSLGTEDVYSPAGKDKARAVFNDAAQILPKNAELGQINSCGVSGVDTNGITDIVTDACNHIHIGIPDD